MHYFSRVIITFLLIPLLGIRCSTKAYSVEKFKIDSNLRMIFNSLTTKDTIYFSDSVGEKKTFVLTKVDSAISNKKGGFIEQRPYKALFIKFKQTGHDTTILERENEIVIAVDPQTQQSGITIGFNNLYYYGDSISKNLKNDTIILNSKIFTKYYEFKSKLNFKHSGDVRILYLDNVNGFLAFETFEGKIWINAEIK